jgi:hypothetical protein
MKLKNKIVFDYSIIDFSKVHTIFGNISVIENCISIPFDVKKDILSV